jgi:hypothetical protein
MIFLKLLPAPGAALRDACKPELSKLSDIQHDGFAPGSGQVGFVVDKVALGQVFSEYFGFPANLHSTNYSTITLINHLRL